MNIRDKYSDMKAYIDLTNLMKKYNIYSDSKMEQLMAYMEGILKWNEKVNITSITDPSEFISKHYIDSLLISETEVFSSSANIIDIGTGGGFPGVPLAIAYPEKNFLLVDSLNKRLKIIDDLTYQLDILNVDTCHGRAEDLARKNDYREKMDLCISRAVANLTSLVELCLPFVCVEGYFVAYKGPSVYDEIESAQNAINILGGRIFKVSDAACVDGEEHKLLIIEKIKLTPDKYPRKAGEPIKNPLK